MKKSMHFAGSSCVPSPRARAGIRGWAALLSAGSLVSLAWAGPALAQPSAAAEAASPGDEIIVTARKRQESILKVPVIVTALSQDKLDRLQTTEIADLPRLVPGLNLGQSLLSIGVLVAIRGIGTSASDPGVDQSVSLNIDGLSLGQGLAFGSGLFDLQQIEVLKGPQALFYGKSSPGGVISLRTADPTNRFELIARAGYEFEGREGKGELIVSGPLNETLKGRLAGTYSMGQGYFTNHAQGIPSLGSLPASSPHNREPHPRNAIIRGTLLWNPSDSFSARLKANYVYDRALDAETEQIAGCPDGPIKVFDMPGVGPVPYMGNESCKLDRELNITYFNPANFPGVPNNGVPYLQNRQAYGTLELNYDLMPELALTSTTGVYRLWSSSLVNTTHTNLAAPNLAATNRFRRRELTEELRLNSDFGGPLNFTIGAFYQDGRVFDRVRLRGNTAYPAFANTVIDGSTTVEIKTYSAFGQLRYKITPELELAGGARWTDETRRERLFNYVTNVDYTNSQAVDPTDPTRMRLLPLPPRRVHASNVSPEVTLTYTPTDDLTLFAAYKKGYKSGSFSIATPTGVGGNNAFGDERVQGGEIGVKTRLADRRLLLNIALYDYRYKGLQVGAIEPSVGGIPLIRTVNAGGARTYGVDFEASYRPALIEGLGLNGAVNWNHGRYTKLNNVPCYSGQTIAQGCTQFLNPMTLRFTGQDLSGTPLIRAPEWQATFGFDYEFPVGPDLKMVLTNSNQYSSRYVSLLAVGRPGNDNFQPSFVKSDISLALMDARNRWEVAVVGKNVTDKITSSNCNVTNYEGGTFLGGAITGSTTSGPAGFAEKACFTERGRSVWLRLTLRPFN